MLHDMKYEGVEGQVLNRKYLPGGRLPAGAVYIGRPSKWGNPFVIGRDGDRLEVISQYRQFLWRNDRLLADLHELVGRKLVCHCAPMPCHGDVLWKAAKWWAERSACEGKSFRHRWKMCA